MPHFIVRDKPDINAAVCIFFSKGVVDQPIFEVKIRAIEVSEIYSELLVLHRLQKTQTFQKWFVYLFHKRALASTTITQNKNVSLPYILPLAHRV